MDKLSKQRIEDIYADAAHWHVNIGDETIHAKRSSGSFRKLKWYIASLWLIFFAFPYLRWNDHQAILFDIPNRQFHLFGVTVWPQDVWMLSLVLILLAMVLFGVTAVAGRVWCGYFCFQTVWTDLFTWIEEAIEGNPNQRRKLDDASWGVRKIRLRLSKHALFLLVSVLTGFTFEGYFVDIYFLWHDYMDLNVPMIGWVVLGGITLSTYTFAGFMREQVCFWLCPYARIQAAMVDQDTILPTYDLLRGEPRGKISGNTATSSMGDCIDCNLCVSVCPTGVDIREGMQEGCITCGMCIDACNGVMEKIGKPKGLIRYASEKELEGEVLPPLYKRPRVIAYSLIIFLSLGIIVYGLNNISPLEMTVVHGRQPLFTLMSDGSIQNKYTVKIANKMSRDISLNIMTKGIPGILMKIEEGSNLTIKASDVMAFHVFLRTKPGNLEEDKTPVRFIISENGKPEMSMGYTSVFVSPDD